MKKVFKKAVSLLLCAALLATSFGVGGVFSSASAENASAQTDEFYELTIMTKCFYTDEYGELVETEAVLPGENVKFRVYVGTNYVSTNSTFMFFFDPNVFADSNPYNTEFNLHVNPAIDSVVKEAIAFKFDSQNARLQYLVSEGYIDAEYVDSHDAYAVQLMLESVPGFIQYDADEWLFEFDMVATENIDAIGSLEVHQGSLLSPESPRGFIDVPVVTDTEQPLETSLPLYLVEVSACLEFCNIIVKDSVPVTFHANGGRFNDGSEIQFSEIPYNGRISASDVEIPTRDGYIFDGWFDESGEYIIDTVSRNGTEVYAGWVGEEFNLILDANGGEFYDGNTRLACAIPYGEPINYFVDEPTKVGCKFAGWKNSETEEIYYDLSICMPQKDLYLEAVWEYYLYAAVYNANSGYFADGTNEIYIEHMYGDMLLPPEEPERVGYTFIGWTQEEGADILVDIESMTMPIDGISFYAVFVPCEDTAYTVNTYMMNNEGIYELTETVLYAETTDNNVEYLPPEIEGFTVNEEHSRLAGVVQGDGSLLLEVYYDRNKYSIVLNNTYEIVSNEYYYGSEIVEPEIPIRPGYVFDGWVDGEGNYVQFPYEMPSYCVTFTAVFSACEYNVYYDLEGGCFPDGEDIRTEIYEYGAEVYCPAYPVKEGYTFVGWADGETGEEIILPFVMPEYDVILKAEWAANEYEIIFDDGYGNEIDVHHAEYGIEISQIVYEAQIPTRYGYTFSRWFNETTGEYFEEGMIMPAHEIRFVPVWTANEYAATFISDGVTVYEDRYLFDSVVELPEGLYKTGYTFEGWADGEGRIYSAGDDYIMPGEDVTFTAVYIAGTDTPYTVEVYIMETDGCYPDEASEAYLFVGDTDCVVTVPEEHFLRDGFYLDMGNSVLEGIIMADGSTVLKVYLERVSYTLDVDIDGNIESTEYYYGSIVTEPEYPEKVGFYFDSWVDENGEKMNFPFEMPAEDVTINAAWIAAEYTVTFDAGEGRFSDGYYRNEYTYCYGEEIISPEDPIREGYVFAGWEPSIPDYMPANNIEFTALWTPEVYRITFTDGFGTIFYEVDLYYGESTAGIFDIADTPTMEGYVFVGWVNEATGSATVPETMPSYDITYTARWERVFCDVKWLNEGEIWRSKHYEYGSEIYYPEEPIKEGYIFMGWTDENLNFIECPFVVTDNISFMAAWEPIECTLVFDANGAVFSYGMPEMTQTLRYGDEIVVPETPCKEGYYFAGWSTEPDSPYIVQIPDTMPAYDLHLFAIWKVAEYTISFDDGFGNNFLTLSMDYGEDLGIIEYISCPNPENRNFLGWRDADTGEVFVLPATMPARDVTLIAEWDYSEHTVIFNYSGGYDIDGNTESAVTGYNGDYVDIEEPMREGYTFAGWIDAEGNHVEMPYIITDRDVVVTAMWEANIYQVIINDGFGNREVIGEYCYGEEAILPVLEREGYTFAGWYNEYTGMFYEDCTIMPAQNLELFAQWTVNQYTVRWIVDGVSDEETVYEFGQEITPPENPVKEGYVFAGWSPSVPQTMPANNMEFTAVWEALGSVTYTVETYVMNTSGEYILSTTYHTAEQSGEVSVSPVISEGFELNSDLSVLEGYAYPENELVLKIYIDRQSFTFTKIIDGIFYAAEYLYGSIIGEPETPVKDGYNFIGWDSVIPSTMPTNDVTITAIFEVAEPEDIYNLGEETYSFRNFVDSDSSGHCFGMSSTSAGYHIGELAIEEINGSEDSDLYALSRTETVQAPICKYQAIQGSYSLYSTVAGGRYYKTKKYNISSDWEAVVNYVKNHEYDDKGTLQIGYRKEGRGGHAVNFLRYEEVDGQARIYAYDNNFPTKETYFYMDENGDVLQAPSSTFKAPIDCIALRSIPEYFNLANDFDTTRCIYADRDTIVVSGASEYSIDGNIENSDVELCEKVVFEIPAGVEQVTITSLVDNASFTYMGEEYSFGKDDNNVGVLILASSEEGGANDNSAFEITNRTASISICTPSVTNINYGDRIILYADVSNIPEGGYVKWSASNRNFSYTVSSNGAACVITPSSSGDTTFTATICDAKGNVVSSDNQTMTAKAGFFDKIIAFFKKIFGSTKIIVQNIDD